MPRGINSDVQALGSVLGGERRIRIPRYQRSFSWRSEHISRLWDDLQSTAEDDDPDKTMFIGSVVFNEDEKETFLVDGQQRLVTVSLVLAALRHRLRSITPEQHIRGGLISKIEELLFIDGNPSNLPRMELSERDSLAFTGLLKNGSVTSLPPALKRAWSIINESLGDLDKVTDITEFGFSLYRLIKETVAVSVINVRPPQNPFSVFEALNSTGQDLAQSELIKNRVLQVARRESQRDLSAIWDKMVEVLPENEVTNYLRYWWALEYRFVSAKKLYTSVRNELHSPELAEDWVHRWHDGAKYFVWLYEGSGENLRPPVQEALSEYAEFNFKQGRPIVQAFLSRNYYSSVPEVVSLLSKVYVRVLKSAQTRGSKFESKVEKICSAIRKSENDGLQTLREETDALSQQAGPIRWDNLVVDDISFARYLLRKLSRKIEGATREVPSTAVMEVEHILPITSAEDALGNRSGQDYGWWVSHIGNLTLLMKEDQPRCSNRPFSEKREIYKEYAASGDKPLRLTFDLTRSEDWGTRQILGRAADLAAIADTIW